MTNLAKQVKEGTYKGGKNVAFGFDMPDVIMLNYDETATTTVPDDVRAAVEAAKKQIVEGKIDTLAAESAAPAAAGRPVRSRWGCCCPAVRTTRAGTRWRTTR